MYSGIGVARLSRSADAGTARPIAHRAHPNLNTGNPQIYRGRLEAIGTGGRHEEAEMDRGALGNAAAQRPEPIRTRTEIAADRALQRIHRPGVPEHRVVERMSRVRRNEAPRGQRAWPAAVRRQGLQWLAASLDIGARKPDRRRSNSTPRTRTHL